MVALAPGGVAIAVVGAIVTWLRGRRAEVTLRITGTGGRSVEISARGVRGMDAATVARLVTDTVAVLEGPAVGSDPAGD